MNKSRFSLNFSLSFYQKTYWSARFLTFKVTKNQIEECYKLLGIPLHSTQDVIRKAFIDLAKKYHPDSGSSDADISKFVSIEKAFRTLTKHNTGASNAELDQIVHDIKHVAPQHRQYLSFDGVGYGTPSQRQKQYAQFKAQRAASNVMEHRIAKAVATENTLMKKESYSKKHDIKTKYGFDRLVEDLIQESISKGEFDNLNGKGKPLQTQNKNPYVDFTTHKINEVLINNGFTPEWITMNKEINQEIEQLKEKISEQRMYLGPYPLDVKDKEKWNNIYDAEKEIAKDINSKINKYNLIVPMLNKQKFHIDFDKICNEILKNGKHSQKKKIDMSINRQDVSISTEDDNFISLFFKAFGEVFNIDKEKKKIE